MASGSKDALRHVGDAKHHVERTNKGERLDRHDGTGRGAQTTKKAGAGKGAWGVETDPMIEEMQEEELDAGPDAVSPRDFVDNNDVLTMDEFEERKAQVKA